MLNTQKSESVHFETLISLTRTAHCSHINTVCYFQGKKARHEFFDSGTNISIDVSGDQSLAEADITYSVKCTCVQRGYMVQICKYFVTNVNFFAHCQISILEFYLENYLESKRARFCKHGNLLLAFF